MSGVVSFILPEDFLTMALSNPTLQDLYFLSYHSVLATLYISAVIIRTEIIQLCCFRNAINQCTGVSTICCVMEHPALLAQAKCPDRSLWCRIINRNIRQLFINQIRKCCFHPATAWQSCLPVFAGIDLWCFSSVVCEPHVYTCP